MTTLHERRMAVAAASALMLLTLILLAVPGARGAAGTSFNPPVKVTPDLGFGYEPATVVDGFGNIFVTAHKENWQLALAPDANSPTSTRSMSWVWTSVDGGKSFVDPPGLTSLSIELSSLSNRAGSKAIAILEISPRPDTRSRGSRVRR